MSVWAYIAIAFAAITIAALVWLGTIIYGEPDHPDDTDDWS